PNRSTTAAMSALRHLRDDLLHEDKMLLVLRSTAGSHGPISPASSWTPRKKGPRRAAKKEQRRAFTPRRHRRLPLRATERRAARASRDQKKTGQTARAKKGPPPPLPPPPPPPPPSASHKGARRGGGEGSSQRGEGPTGRFWGPWVWVFGGPRPPGACAWRPRH